MPEPIIKIEDLSFSYTADQKALKNISLEVAEGEYLAIVGANGAGKTTLCLFMNGIIPNVIGGRVSGSVIVDGMDTFDYHVYDIAQRVGLVLQDPEAQLFAADVTSEIAFAAENRGIAREIIIPRLAEVVRIVRLDGLEDRLSDELSGGQKQRLAIAANLVVQPKILVADEPTSQLDPIGKEQVFATLAELNKNEKMTVVIASHDVDEIERYADRVIVLDEGNLILSGTPAEVFREIKTLDRIYVHVPDLARLGNTLGINKGQPLSLDVNKAAEQLRAWIKKNKGTGAAEKIVIPAGSSVKSTGTRDTALGKGIAVKVDHLTFQYPGTLSPAIMDIDVEIKEGEFIGLIGQNGSGKTTLMKCLVGLLKPQKGAVMINEKPIAGQKVGVIAAQIGLILQNPDTQLFAMSVQEEIEFGLANLNLSEAELKERVDEALKITSLTEFRDLYPFKLSLGDRRKVAVASIVAMRPPILIFDEPLTGQDYKGRYELTNMAANLHRDGHTVIMISHDMELVAQYTQRTLVLGIGKLLLDASTRDVFDHVELLHSTFIEPPEIIRLAQALRPAGLPSGLLTVEEVTRALLEIIK